MSTITVKTEVEKIQQGVARNQARLAETNAKPEDAVDFATTPKAKVIAEIEEEIALGHYELSQFRKK